MSEAKVDLITPQGGSGELAQRIAGGFDIYKGRPWIGDDGLTYINANKAGELEAIKVNADATLRKDEWIKIDEQVVKVARERLVGIADLKSKGLVYKLNNPYATPVLMGTMMDDPMEAQVTMDAIARGKGDRPVYEQTYLPIPIIHSAFEMNDRFLQVARAAGNPIDTDSAEAAARRCAETLENMLFTDITYPYGGGTIYSYLNHPSRIPGSLTAAWTSTGYTGADIIADVLAMKQEAIDNRRYGPYVLYVPTAYETILDMDFSTAKGTNTIRERILQIGNIQAVTVVDRLTANNVLLVQMTSDVVRLVEGWDFTTVQWQELGGFVNKFMVMTIQVPQIRTSKGQLTGVVHYT